MFKPKDQIIYIPPHAEGDIGHHDVEFGFVFNTQDESCFCRFWEKGDLGTLRTTSCSELVSEEYLRLCVLLPQEDVDITYEGILIFDSLGV